MARKRHTKKHRRSSRRRVGAMSPSSPVVMVAAIAAGYFLGDTINAAVDKVLPASMSTGTGMTGYIPTAAEAGLGALLLFKGKKTLVKSAAGGVLLGAGIKRGLKKAGVISGYQSVPVIGRRMGGYQSVPVIGGVPNMLTGGVPGNVQPDFGPNTPKQLSGYGVNGYRPNGSRVLGSLAKTSAGGAFQGSGVTNSGSGFMS